MLMLQIRGKFPSLGQRFSSENSRAKALRQESIWNKVNKLR